MYRLFVSCFFLINIAPKLFSLFMAFDRSNIICSSSFILFWIFSIFSTWLIVFGSETAVCAVSLDCFASQHFLD